MDGARRLAFLFPGQGSQAIGMGRDLVAGVPAARALFELASDAAGADLARLCARGPLRALERTAVLQPALVAVSLACLAVLRDEGVEPDLAAGHSVGLLGALACAGALEPADALSLAAARGREMERAAALRPGAMVAVVGLARAEVEAEIARLFDPADGCVAAVNAPDQIVLSGGAEAMAAARRRFAELRVKVVPLAVSGGWHSPLMEPAVAGLEAALARVALREPRLPVFLDVTAAPAAGAAEIGRALVAQLTRPVLWAPLVRALFDAGSREMVEVGPGSVLRGLLRASLPDHRAYDVHCAGDLPSLRRAAARLARRR